MHDIANAAHPAVMQQLLCCDAIRGIMPDGYCSEVHAKKLTGHTRVA